MGLDAVALVPAAVAPVAGAEVPPQVGLGVLELAAPEAVIPGGLPAVPIRRAVLVPSAVGPVTGLPVSAVGVPGVLPAPRGGARAPVVRGHALPPSGFASAGGSHPCGDATGVPRVPPTRTKGGPVPPSGSRRSPPSWGHGVGRRSPRPRVAAPQSPRHDFCRVCLPVPERVRTGARGGDCDGETRRWATRRRSTSGAAAVRHLRPAAPT